MPNLNPVAKSPYKFKSYIMGPRTGRVHLDDGQPGDSYLDGLPQSEGSSMDPYEKQALANIGVKPAASTDDTEPMLNPDYTSALDRFKQEVLTRPERTPTHWYNRLAAGALGGLAGWSNAASRTRHPIDIPSLSEAVLHPGYAEQLADWQSRVAPLQQAADIEGARQTATGKEEQISGQRESRLLNAQARQQRANPHWGMQKLDPTMAKENYPALAPDEHGEYWISPALMGTMYKVDNKPEPVDRGEVINDPDIATFLGRKVGESVDRTVYNQALEYKRAMAVAGLKPVNQKEDKVALAVRAASGDASAQKALDILSQSTLKSKPPKSGAAPSIINISPAAIEMEARKILSGGQLPAVGYGKEAAKVRADILNRAAELNPDVDLSAAQAQNHALSLALAAQEKQAGQIGSFENTANRNMDVALELSNKVNRTGVPVLNRWIQSGRTNITGDPDAAAFHAAINTVANEYAKVVSSATGGGVTSDSARHEAMSLLNTAQTPQQLQSVINTMRRDMANRIGSFEATRKEQLNRIGAIGNRRPGAPNAPAPPAQQPAGNDKINVQAPGFPPGQIHASQRDKFLADHPGAKVLP